MKGGGWMYCYIFVFLVLVFCWSCFILEFGGVVLGVCLGIVCSFLYLVIGSIYLVRLLGFVGMVEYVLEFVLNGDNVFLLLF